MKNLSIGFTPKLLSINLPFNASHIKLVERELVVHADLDPNSCWGYFPGMGSRDGIDTDLPESQKFAKLVKTLVVANKRVYFNFLRLSLVDQSSISPFHLDSDSSTAITGDAATMANRLVWRLLLNLSDEKSRTVIYLNIDPSSVKLKNDRGYISYPSKLIRHDMIKHVVLPPRKGNKVSTVLFCASRVLHAGKDINGGHFIAGYGIDEDA